jgi:nitrogen fixation NifU-like protein
MQPYYTKKVLEHFLHPKNFGKMKDPSGVGDTQNLRCGDIMKIYIKVAKKGGQEIIQDAKFETFGCGHALAISDMICELIKGKTLADAVKVGYEDVIKDMGPVPPTKVHCAHLAQTAVKAAVEDYKKKQK